MSNPYVRKHGNGWVVIQRKTGKPLHDHEGHPIVHDSKEKADETFRAIEMHKHGGE